MPVSSKLLRTPAMASASVAICLISLKKGFFGYCRIEYGSVEMRLSEINNSEIDIDYIEVIGLCFFV